MSKTTTVADLSNLSSKELVELYNKYSDKPVKKFADRATALKRTAAVLPVKSEPKQPKGKTPVSHEERVKANRARVITILVEGNPKSGSAAERYKLYKDGMTVGEYIKKGGQLRDVTWDCKQNWISVE